MARILIAGGGPAGLAAAIVAASQGAAVVVLERRLKGFDKACGEGIMPRGVRWLRRYGVELDGVGRRFFGVTYIDNELRCSGYFGHRHSDDFGLAIRRPELIRRLRARAQTLGVQLEDGAAVGAWGQDGDGVWCEVDGSRRHGDYGVVATGLHPSISLGMDRQREASRSRKGLASSSQRYGLRIHKRLAPWCDEVEVHWSSLGEAYITPVADDEIGIAILTRRRPLRWLDLLDSFPALRERIERVESTSALRGAGPLRYAPDRLRAGRIGFIGDSAGYLDPCTGEGISLALCSAEAWVKATLMGRPWLYPWLHHRLFARYALFTQAMLALGWTPRFRRFGFQTAARFPALFSTVLSWSH